MKLLSVYTPAETIVVTKGGSATLKELVKLTFIDLLLKQVLKTTEITRQPHPNDPPITNKYIVIGKDFYSYRPLPHERLFLSPFLTDDTSQLLFRNYVKLVYQKASTLYSFQKKVIQSSNLSSQYTQSFYQKIFGGFTHTKAGDDAYKQLTIEIAALETTLPEIAKTDPDQITRIWKKIGGNIFLVTTLNLALLQQIDDTILSEIIMEPESSASGCSSCGSWDSFASYSDSFDSSCSSDSGCSSDGGGGDSGCSSGCSGCGGGCGGGD